MTDAQQQDEDEGPCEYRGIVYRTYGDLAQVIQWRRHSDILREQAEQVVRETLKTDRQNAGPT